MCNLFRPHYHLGTFVTEAMLCAPSLGALQGKFNFSLFVLSCAAAICPLCFLWVALDGGRGWQQQFLLGYGAGLQLDQAGDLPVLLVQAREAPKEKKMKKR